MDQTPDGAIPVDQFQAANDQAPPDAIPIDQFESADEHYGSLGQQALAGVEGVAKGIAGPLATLAETKVLGVNPEDIKAREEANPWTHGLSEATGFGASLLTGTGEAALLGKAGEAAAHAIGLGEAATTGAKLAKAATTAATEMGLFQAGDEASKWLLNAPQTPGSVVSNIGLSALLGGVTGPAFAGLGMAAKKALDNPTLKEFADRLAFRKANIDPIEMQRHEAENVVNTYNNMNSEISGPQGLKAQAIQNLLPKETNKAIQVKVSDIANKMISSYQEMEKSGVQSRHLNTFLKDAEPFLKVATDPASNPSQIFDAMNDLKKNLQDYSKGNWGPFAVPRYHEAYDFLNITKNLSRDLRTALEDSSVFGKAADIQKELNSSWTKALPAMKDFEKKFMTKVGDHLEISADKFNTYSKQGLKSTTLTDRQKMLGNFVDAMDQHFKTVDKIYQSAGVENPYPAVGMGALKESLEKPSLGNRLADMWHDRLGAHAIGNTIGSGIGGMAGSTLGHGLEGVYLGRELLGPIFSGMLKPIMERYPNVDLGAFQQAISIAKNIEKGNSNLTAAASAALGGAKTFPSQIIPSQADIKALDDKTKQMGESVGDLSNVAGNTGYYLPGHDTSIAKTSGDAVAYLNSKRPMAQKALPLDNDPKISSEQKSAFHRTLSIAQQPLMVFKHVKDGTLIPQDVQTLQAIYPDYYQKMNEQLMHSIVDQVQEGKQIPYKIKQSASLFLGQPLDSAITPQAIQSAQRVFMQQRQSAAQAAKPVKNTSKLTKAADNHFTANEAAISRRNSAKS